MDGNAWTLAFARLSATATRFVAPCNTPPPQSDGAPMDPVYVCSPRESRVSCVRLENRATGQIAIFPLNKMLKAGKLRRPGKVSLRYLG